MYLTYEDSVIAHTDNNLCLSFKLAKKLLADHGFTFDDVYENSGGIDPVALDQRNAEALLTWLGY
jgi:hypothetical protein